MQMRRAAVVASVVLVLSGCSVGRTLERWAYPREEAQLQILMELAKPEGIDLVSTDAVDRLRENRKIVGLKVVGNRFDYFVYVADSEMSNFAKILELTRFRYPAFLDAKPGFMIYDFPMFQTTLTGREYYFNARYELCNNVLFSKRPLSSATFVVLVFNEASSLRVLEREGLVCLYAHASSELYDAIRNH